MGRPAKKLYFIYNPHAGKENIRGKMYGILQTLADADYELTVYPTRGPPGTPSNRFGIFRRDTIWWYAAEETGRWMK